MLTATNWRRKFPALSGISKEVSNHLNRTAKSVQLKQGAFVFGQGRPEQSLVLVASGSIRVQQHSEMGWEIVLYRVRTGESCVLTTADLLPFENHTIKGIAETDVEAITIPRDDLDTLLSISKEFRAFLFEAYSKHIVELFFVGGEISIRRMDIGAAQEVLELVDDRTTLGDPRSACRGSADGAGNDFETPQILRMPWLDQSVPRRNRAQQSQRIL